MVWYDFVALAILVYAVWSGAQRGLITQLAWIAALILCFKFADKLAPIIEPQINVEQPLRHWVAMFVLYIGFSLGSFMAARVLNSWMEKAKFKDFDRHLGAVLGLFKGVVVVLVVTFFAVTLSGSLKATVLHSQTGEAACWILDNVEPLTPEYFHDYLAKYREELAPIHNEHLGHPTSFTDLLGGHREESQPGGDEQPQDNGFSLPEYFNGLGGGTEAGQPGSTGSTDIADVPTFDQMWRKLPQQLKDDVGTEIQQRWNSATPEQKQDLVNGLSQSFGTRLPSVVNDFLTSAGSRNDRQGTGTAGGTFQERLNEIGDIYRDRETIVQRTMEHLAGVPPQVRDAVIDDWYADLTMRATDPDTTTTVATRLDDRILRQLDKAGIWQQLSFDLKQRLNQSRR